MANTKAHEPLTSRAKDQLRRTFSDLKNRYRARSHDVTPSQNPASDSKSVRSIISARSKSLFLNLKKRMRDRQSDSKSREGLKSGTMG